MNKEQFLSSIEELEQIYVAGCRPNTVDIQGSTRRVWMLRFLLDCRSGIVYDMRDDNDFSKYEKMTAIATNIPTLLAMLPIPDSIADGRDNVIIIDIYPEDLAQFN